MLERLRNMEPLSGQEEYRIRSRLRNIILLLAGMVLAFAIWAIVQKKGFSPVYYVIIVVFLLCNWLLMDVAPLFLCRAIAGRTDRQVSAFFKLMGLGLLGNLGLGWFLLAMNNQSIYGALVYLISTMAGRKQREIYFSKDEEAEKEPAPKKPEKEPDHLPTAADRMNRLNELSRLADQEAGLPAEEVQDTENTEDTENVQDTVNVQDTEANDGSV